MNSVTMKVRVDFDTEKPVKTGKIYPVSTYNKYKGWMTVWFVPEEYEKWSAMSGAIVGALFGKFLTKYDGMRSQMTLTDRADLEEFVCGINFTMIEETQKEALEKYRKMVDEALECLDETVTIWDLEEEEPVEIDFDWRD